MSELVEITVNGNLLHCDAGISIAAALLNGGVWTFRRSVQGDARGPLCGMGVCYECRVSVNGVPHRRACLQTVEQGMEITTA